MGTDPQPVEHRPLTRRIERRFRRRGRGRHGADRSCQRRRRVDPHPGVVLRAGRPEAVAGADHARSVPRREQPGRRAVRQPHRCATPRRCSMRCTARASATPSSRPARAAVRRRARRRPGPAAHRPARPPSVGRGRARRVRRARPATRRRLLESLGHHVEPSFPAGAGQPRLRQAVRRAVEHQHGRRPGPDRRTARARGHRSTTSSWSTGRRPSSPAASAASTTRWRWRPTSRSAARCSSGGHRHPTAWLRPAAHTDARASRRCRSARSPTTLPRRWHPWCAPVSTCRSPPPFNSSGQPAISLPLHWTPDGPAGRRPAGRGLRPRGRADQGGVAARAGRAVGGAPTCHLIEQCGVQRAVQPPSTMRLCPVMNEPAGVASISSAPSSSCSWPMRGIGEFWAMNRCDRFVGLHAGGHL